MAILYYSELESIIQKKILRKFHLSSSEVGDLMKARTYSLARFDGLMALLALGLIMTGSAWSQLPTPAAEWTPPGFAIPVKPPRGWGAEQWRKLRAGCLHISQKVYKHQPLTLNEVHADEVCMDMAPPPPSATGVIPPGANVLPPPPSTGPSPTPMPTPVPGISPQSNGGGVAIQPAAAAAPVVGPFGNPISGGGDASRRSRCASCSRKRAASPPPPPTEAAIGEDSRSIDPQTSPRKLLWLAEAIALLLEAVSYVTRLTEVGRECFGA